MLGSRESQAGGRHREHGTDSVAAPATTTVISSPAGFTPAATAAPNAASAATGRVTPAAVVAPTATRHTKRLLLASFQADPRSLIEDVVAAQMECMRGWELAEANRAWDERREARFFPPPAGV